MAAVDLIVAVLPRHRAFGSQDLVSLPGDRRQIARCGELLEGGLRLTKLSLGLRQRSFRLRHLLIQIRRLDIGELLPGAHAIADVYVAPFQVTGRAGENIRFRDRRDVSRQQQFEFGAARFTVTAFTRGGVILRVAAAASSAFVVRSRGK